MALLHIISSKDDDNTLTQVKAAKRAQAGGIKKSKVEGNSDFRIPEPASPMVPRHVVLVRKGVDAAPLKAALLGMKDGPVAKDALKAMTTPTGFSEADGDFVAIMNGQVRKALGL